MPIKLELLESALKQDILTRNVMRLDDVSSSENAVASGENYTSTIKRVVLDVVLGSGKKMKMSLIVKELPTEGNSLEFLDSEAFFKTEIKLYEEVLPHLEDVLREQDIPPLWPTFLGQRENYLIFSDLKSKNYTVNCRRSRLDLEHATLTVRTLALFHAASVVLRLRGKLDISDLVPTYLTRGTSGVRKFRNGATEVLAKTIINEWGPEWREIGERLLKKATSCHNVEKFGQIDESRLNVLNHGDLWTTNIMFKYSKGLHLPIGVRFIDFQLAHYNSYGFDLIYFLASSLPAEVRRKCRLTLIENYTTMLQKALDLYGLSEIAPSLNDVLAELRRLEEYNMFVIIAVMPVAVSDVEKAFDIEKLVNDADHVVHNPEIYRGSFRQEVEQELIQWAKDGLF